MDVADNDLRLSLATLGDRLPIPVPPGLHPLLDAARECLARHGPSRTSLSDIAREMGVAPSTVYRKAGSVDNATLLYFAREVQRFVERIPELMASAEGSRAVTTVLAEGVEALASDPVAAKILRDEGDWMGRTVTRRLDGLFAQGVEIVEPFLVAAIEAGLVRRQDPSLLAHWLVRVALAAVVSPPPGDVAHSLEFLLLPVLTATDPPRKIRPGRRGTK